MWFYEHCGAVLDVDGERRRGEGSPQRRLRAPKNLRRLQSPHTFSAASVRGPATPTTESTY